MKRILSVLLTAAMLFALLIPFSVHAVITPSDLAYAPEAESAPILDGELDEVYLTAPEYVMGRIIKNDSTNAAARDSSRVTFRTVHNNGYQYLMIDILDDVQIVGADSSNHWNNDCLMMFFSEDCNSTAFGSNGRSYQMYFYISETETAQAISLRKTDASVKLPEDSQYFCKIAEKNEDGSYHARLEIRLKTVHETQQGNNAYVTQGNPVIGVGGACAMDFQFNDADKSGTPNNRTIVWSWAVDADYGPANSTNEKDKWGHVRYVESTHNIFDAGSEWRYMTATNDPAAAPADWELDPSVSAEWTTAPAPFGCRAPGATKNWATVQDPENGDGTCENAYFWAVKEFTLSADDLEALEGKALLSSMFYDQDIKVYVNGHLLYSHGGENNLYRNKKLCDNAADLLFEGTNIVAVSLHQFAGGYEFDMNLYATSGDTERYTAQTEVKEIAIAEGENYSFYYQTRTNAADETATDFRVLFVADIEWLNSLTSMEAVITFSNGTEEKTKTITPSTVYKTVSAPETVYIASDGAVVFGWIVSGMPADFATAETVTVTATLNTK